MPDTKLRTSSLRWQKAEITPRPLSAEVLQHRTTRMKFQLQAKFRVTVNKTTGQIENYTYNNDVLIKNGPVGNYWRARLDNDKTSSSDAKKGNIFETVGRLQWIL